ncbi:hypothetical protein EI94DRAFT_1290245 [Lactarius quietus]|nr:hypothetical protein EI94DRAFT_1290245 [Lactarius quietus]
MPKVRAEATSSRYISSLSLAMISKRPISTSLVVCTLSTLASTVGSLVLDFTCADVESPGKTRRRSWTLVSWTMSRRRSYPVCFNHILSVSPAAHLKWVSQSSGSDRSKVTIWEESAGSIRVWESDFATLGQVEYFEKNSLGKLVQLGQI